MLPAAISCSLGFHTWVRCRSISVTSTRRCSRSPSRVASSRPPAPPPTITTRCRVDGLAVMGWVVRRRSGLGWHVVLHPIEDLFGLLGVDGRLVVELRVHALLVQVAGPLP